MPLVNLQTNLKDLKFGNDRPGLTDSEQPYIVAPIPGPNEQIEPNYPDFLLRGGTTGVTGETAEDLLRLSKFLNDRTSPLGAQFVLKQEMLSRIGVRTQASGFLLNEGAYNPLNTLAQAGISIEGGHIPKQGLITFRGPNKYLDALQDQINENKGIKPLITSEILSDTTPMGSVTSFINDALPPPPLPPQPIFNNRLVQLNEVKRKGEPWKKKYKKDNQISKFDTEVLSYGGGPDSVLGVGGTQIKIALGRLGAPLTTGIGNVKLYGGNIGFPNGIQVPSRNKEFVKYREASQQDFRRDKLKDAEGVSTIMGVAPSYNPANNQTIDNNAGTSRINYTTPGQRGNVIDYTQGKLSETGEKLGPVDRINALPIYRSGYVIADPVKNDLIKFRIGAVDNDNPNVREFIHFRAYIDSFSDNYNSNWMQQKYMGRGEIFHKYDSFTRDINMGFTVAAQSREEMMIMYKKLNFLVSNLAPDYTKSGYMAGPLVQLTLGGWCYELPGFIKSMTLDVPEESPWEIGIPNLDGEDEHGGIKFRDSEVKEMPMICKVSGFVFTPIHRFNPSKQKNLFGDKGAFGIDFKNKEGVRDGKYTKWKDQEIRTITEYGKQRFIQLDDGGKNNAYDNQPADPIEIINDDRKLNIDT
jgi:hypothetical protein